MVVCVCVCPRSYPISKTQRLILNSRPQPPTPKWTSRGGSLKFSFVISTFTYQIEKIAWYLLIGQAQQALLILAHHWTGTTSSWLVRILCLTNQEPGSTELAKLAKFNVIRERSSITSAGFSTFWPPPWISKIREVLDPAPLISWRKSWTKVPLLDSFWKTTSHFLLYLF